MAIVFKPIRDELMDWGGWGRADPSRARGQVLGYSSIGNPAASVRRLKKMASATTATSSAT